MTTITKTYHNPELTLAVYTIKGEGFQGQVAVEYEWGNDVESIVKKPVYSIDDGDGSAHCIWLSQKDIYYTVSPTPSLDEAFKMIAEDLLL